jgi:acyl-CoA thioester hydrolase
MKELLLDYPITIEIPVVWGEMDAFQHVNNIVYFRYFESARISYFEKLDYMKFLEESGVGPILASTQCSFKIPLTYPDRVTVGAKVESIGAERFTMKYVVVSHSHKKIAALGEGVIVSFNYRENKKAKIPDEIRNRIMSLEKNETP